MIIAKFRQFHRWIPNLTIISRKIKIDIKLRIIINSTILIKEVMKIKPRMSITWRICHKNSIRSVMMIITIKRNRKIRWFWFQRENWWKLFKKLKNWRRLWRFKIEDSWMSCRIWKKGFEMSTMRKYCCLGKKCI